MNGSLLIVGLGRVVLWSLFCAIALHRHQWYRMTGSALAGACSVVFAFTAAGAVVSDTIIQAATILSTPAVALIVTGELLHGRR